MDDIDDAVELARRCLDVGGADYNECDLNALARAVLGMTTEVARLRAFKLHAASCYNSWANGDTSPYAAVAALEAIGDELGEPFAEGDRG